MSKKKGDLVRITKLNGPPEVYNILTTGTIGVVLTVKSDIGWGHLDQRVYFPVLGQAIWLWDDETELVK